MLILNLLFGASKALVTLSIVPINWTFHLPAFQYVSSSCYFQKQVLRLGAPICPCTPFSFVDFPEPKSKRTDEPISDIEINYIGENV